MKELILVPDVHGRAFWKEVIPYVEEGTPCIFLGDYNDPYKTDGLSDLDALENFRELLAFADTHSDKVTLLLGNHDLSYFGEPLGIWTVYADRFSYAWADHLSEYFNENRGRFSLCAFREIGGKPFVFSHAGLHPLWMSWSGLFDDIKDPMNGAALVERIDTLFQESLKADERTEFMEALAMVGSFRGGNAFAGSMVWADVREYGDTVGPFTQIFGHTQQRDGTPYYSGNNICIDCCRCFYLDEEGMLRYLEDDRPAK